jgi:hypothetical protein
MCHLDFNISVIDRIDILFIWDPNYVRGNINQAVCGNSLTRIYHTVTDVTRVSTRELIILKLLGSC